MDGNEDEALKCLKIGKDVIESGDRVRGLKFISKARRLDPSLPVDDLLSDLDGQSIDNPAIGSSSNPSCNDKADGLHRRTDLSVLSVGETRKQYELVGSDEPVYERRAARRTNQGFGNSNGFYYDGDNAEEFFRNFFFGGMNRGTATQFNGFSFGPGMGARMGGEKLKIWICFP